MNYSQGSQDLSDLDADFISQCLSLGKEKGICKLVSDNIEIDPILTSGKKTVRSYVYDNNSMILSLVLLENESSLPKNVLGKRGTGGYEISYSGSEISKNLEILDEITRSLKTTDKFVSFEVDAENSDLYLVTNEGISKFELSTEKISIVKTPTSNEDYSITMLDAEGSLK